MFLGPVGVGGSVVKPTLFFNVGSMAREMLE